MNRSLLENIAERTNFQIAAVEKVMLLRSILSGLTEHETISKQWVLKGGTALNLFYLPLQRLSVDIDLNFIGTETLDNLPKARKFFEQVLTNVCEREGCRVIRIPETHAGGKFRLRYSSIFGGAQNIEVDVNYLSRVPLIDPTKLSINFPPSGMVDSPLVVPILSLEELAAGKFNALLARHTARDMFDAKNILLLKSDMITDASFRVAFICFIASIRKDVRVASPELFKFNHNEIKNSLLPLVRLDIQQQSSSKILIHQFEETVVPAVSKLLTFSTAEKTFLDNFYNHARILPNLLTNDVKLQDRIRNQPALLWKQRHLTNFLSR